MSIVTSLLFYFLLKDDISNSITTKSKDINMKKNGFVRSIIINIKQIVKKMLIKIDNNFLLKINRERKYMELKNINIKNKIIDIFIFPINRLNVGGK